MKVAITGSTGFIGRYVLRRLLDLELDVFAVGLSAPQDPRLRTFVQSNLLREENFQWIDEYRPSHIIHLAWYAKHKKYWTSPLNLDWLNATYRLASKFSRAGGTRIVVAGTCAEYDWNYGYCKEQLTPLIPSTLYGLAKKSTFQLLQQISKESDLSVGWGRIFLPFGEGENPKRLIPSLVNAMSGDIDPFAVDISQWRDFLAVEDTANALVHALDFPSLEDFNISSGKPTQLLSIIQLIADFLDKDSSIILSKSKPDSLEHNFLFGDNSRLLNTGWTPKLDLYEALEKYVKVLS